MKKVFAVVFFAALFVAGVVVTCAMFDGAWGNPDILAADTTAVKGCYAVIAMERVGASGVAITVAGQGHEYRLRVIGGARTSNSDATKPLIVKKGTLLTIFNEDLKDVQAWPWVIVEAKIFKFPPAEYGVGRVPEPMIVTDPFPIVFLSIW